jgi:hypothetical protein
MERNNDQVRKDLYAKATDPYKEQVDKRKKGPDLDEGGAMVRSSKPKKPKSPSNASARVVS